MYTIRSTEFHEYTTGVLRSVVNMLTSSDKRASELAHTHTPYSICPFIPFLNTFYRPSTFRSVCLPSIWTTSCVSVCSCDVFASASSVLITLIRTVSHIIWCWTRCCCLRMTKNSRPSDQTTRVFVCAFIISISFCENNPVRRRAVMRCALFTLPKGQSTHTHLVARDVRLMRMPPNDTCLRQRCGHSSELLMPTLSNCWRPSPPNRRQREHIWIIEITLRYSNSEKCVIRLWVELGVTQPSMLHASQYRQPAKRETKSVCKYKCSQINLNVIDSFSAVDWRTVDGRQELHPLKFMNIHLLLCRISPIAAGCYNYSCCCWIRVGCRLHLRSLTTWVYFCKTITKLKIVDTWDCISRCVNSSAFF